MAVRAKDSFDAQTLSHNADAKVLKRNGKDMGRQYITQHYTQIYPEYVIRYIRA